MCLLQLINAGKGEALRIRAILQSLVPTTDLVGIISIPLNMPVLNKGMSVLVALFHFIKSYMQMLMVKYQKINRTSAATKTRNVI